MANILKYLAPDGWNEANLSAASVTEMLTAVDADHSRVDAEAGRRIPGQTGPKSIQRGNHSAFAVFDRAQHPSYFTKMLLCPVALEPNDI